MNCPVQFVLLTMSVSSVVIGMNIGWVEKDDHVIVFNCFVALAFLEMGKRAGEIGVGVAGIEANRRVEVPNRFFGVTS